MIIWKSLTIVFIILNLSHIVTAVDDKGKETQKRKTGENEGDEHQQGKRIKLEIGGSSQEKDKDAIVEMEIDEEQIAVARNERRRENVIEIIINKLNNLIQKHSSILQQYGEFIGTITQQEKKHLEIIMAILKLYHEKRILNPRNLAYHINEFKLSNDNIISKMLAMWGGPSWLPFFPNDDPKIRSCFLLSNISLVEDLFSLSQPWVLILANKSIRQKALPFCNKENKGNNQQGKSIHNGRIISVIPMTQNIGNIKIHCNSSN